MNQTALHQSGSDPTQSAGMHTAAIGQDRREGSELSFLAVLEVLNHNQHPAQLEPCW